MTEARDGDRRHPFDKALDLGVFAPLGFALEFRRVVPELAEAGRKQVAFSRSLGKAALNTIARAAADRGAARAGSAPASNGAAAPTTPREAASAPKTAPAAPTASGAVAGYDEMTAKEIIALARDASAKQRSWMRAQEEAGKARVTVLRALGAE